MILGDAMAMREAIRRGELAPKDVFSLGPQQIPGSTLAMKPQTIEMFAGFFEEDYERYELLVHGLGSLPPPFSWRPIHPFCKGDTLDGNTPLWLPVDPRHNPPDKRPTHANVNAAQIEKIWERYA